MHKLNEHVYLIINCAILFLIGCVLYLLSPLFYTILKLVLNVLSPFIFGFILASLIYPVIAPIKSKMIKMFVILILYLGLVFCFVTCILVTLPHLIQDFYRFMAFLNIEQFHFDRSLINSLQISSKVLITVFNAAIISLFYLFDASFVSKIYYRIPHHNKLLSRYYDFIEYFYALVMHILIRMAMVFVLMIAIRQPYAMIISLMGLLSIIPILGNIVVYSLLLLCLVYYPIILIPILVILLYDLYFFNQHRYHLLKMLVVFIALRMVHIFLILFTLPVYFLVIDLKKNTYNEVDRR